MASREWLITKIVGLVLGIITLVSICASAANLVATIRNDVSRLDRDVTTHIERDERKFESITAEISSTKSKVHDLELKQATTDAHYQEIMRMLSEIKNELNRWEAINGNK